MQRRFVDYLIISLKGIAMGAADAVPGVSGGTIAFISGIYEELIATISNVNLKLFKIFRQEGFMAFWNALNGNFITALLAGIIISFVSFMRLAKYLLEYHPVLIWSFFFGLIIASIYFVGKQITKWNLATIISIGIGGFVAYYITTIPSLASNDNPLFLFFAGAIAICAMILPGISGSFILVILGAYKTLSDAIHDIDVKKITLFVGGAVIGLLSFSRVLKWLFKHYHNTTLALLTGFIIGSLNKVWPWKKTISVLNETTGEVQLLSEITNIGSLSIFQQQTNDFQTYKTVLEESILPFHYSELNNYLVKDYLLTALALMLVGFLTIFILEKIGSKKS
jgi:putative membrane protein